LVTQNHQAISAYAVIATVIASKAKQSTSALRASQWHPKDRLLIAETAELVSINP
jgi:hypothetical protein